MITMQLSTDRTWERQAACRALGPRATKVFFSDEIHDIATAKRICATCPVMEPCLRTALEQGEQWGVWGGQLFVAGKVVYQKRRRGRPSKVARAEEELPMIPIPSALSDLILSS